LTSFTLDCSAGAAQAIAWFNSLTILAAQKKLIALS
jgi:hypothetical protein